MGNLQGAMTTCLTKLGTGAGDFCTRYATYTTCMDKLLAPCPASLKKQFKTLMQSGTAKYGSQIKKCSSSKSGSDGEKPSGSKTPSGSNSGNACSSSDLQKKSSSCIQKMTAAAAGGNSCGAWQTYECCLKESFASCGSDMQSKTSTMMGTMKNTYSGSLPGLAECASATCSSSARAEVETTIMAHIHLSDPLAFSVDKYVEAVKKATGVAQLPEAVVKAFEIIVKYALPTATEIAAATAAIAKANGVAETQVQVAQGSARRLGARRLSMNVDVTITVPDKTQAAEVLTSASNVTGLASEL